MIKHIKLGDVILVIILAASLFFIISNNKSSNKDIVIIKTSDKSYKYSLREDMILNIAGLYGDSVIEIKSGNIRFLESPCPYKLCIKDGVLKDRAIICMVNAVIINYDKKQDKAKQIDSVVF